MSSETFLDCITDLDKITKECWKIYHDPKTTINDKLLALKTRPHEVGACTIGGVEIPDVW
jgi:hypothetical protein